MRRTDAHKYLQSLQRGIAVLSCLAARDVAMSIRDISDTLGLERTITARILRTLEADELVTRADGRYQVGPRALVFGNAYVDHLTIRRAALPFQIDLLHRTFGAMPWIVVLTVPVGTLLAVVQRFSSPDASLATVAEVGSLLPLDHTAAGRSILAYLPTEDVRCMFGNERAEELVETFKEIRAAGGVDFAAGEVHAKSGQVAIGTAIRTRSGKPIAGITVSGDGLSAELHRQSDVALKLRSTAEQIGQLYP